MKNLYIYIYVEKMNSVKGSCGTCLRSDDTVSLKAYTRLASEYT